MKNAYLSAKMATSSKTLPSLHFVSPVYTKHKRASTAWLDASVISIRCVELSTLHKIKQDVANGYE